MLVLVYGCMKSLITQSLKDNIIGIILVGYVGWVLLIGRRRLIDCGDWLIGRMVGQVRLIGNKLASQIDSTKLVM